MHASAVTPVYKGFIYSVAGRGNDGLTSIGTIDVGAFGK